MITYISEYEHIVLLLILTCLFILGLKRRENSQDYSGFRIDKDYSGALKGIACVLILMSHYEQMIHNGHVHHLSQSTSITFLVGNCAYNIGLVWFMFISGYGLTVSKSGIKDHLLGTYKRCSKVVYPMLFIFTMSLLIYIILPGLLPLNYVEDYVIPQELYMLKGVMDFNIGTFLFAPIKWYWYVWCILMYYVIFYASDYLSQRYNMSMTVVLLLFLSIYYISTFNILGASLAHYYRLTWAFFCGHLFAKWKDIPLWLKLSGTILGLLSFHYESSIMILSFVIAIIIILIVAKLQKKFEFNSRALLFLGSISYIFYLSHRRIGWVVCCYLSTYDMLIWVMMTLIISSMLHKIYYKVIN